ncbi:MAG: wax ester/triacylglycerol synthase family O-acyltransferase [Anaerolineae bacterium]|nr:wax ester/triacylglycerol synthase family O-acyltransferase [Anaerolineae bacterium]
MAGRRTRTDSMSNVDTAWLRMEERNNLMMITGVMTFDAPLDVTRVKQVLRERFLTYERFTQRVVAPALPGQNPRWQTDPNFNLDNHVRIFRLPPPGDKDMLQRLVSHLMSTPLDLTRPPWEFHLVLNVEGHGSAVIPRLHHSIADGIALVSVMLYMTDPTPNPPPRPAEPGPSRGGGNPVTGLFKPLTNTVRGAQKAAGTVLHAGVDALIHPSHVIKAARLGGSTAITVGKLALMPADPPTLFKGPLGNEKRAAWTELIPLPDVKAVGKAMNGTVNDVLLTAVAGALRRYLIEHEQTIEDLNIRAVIPVNLRPLDVKPKLGNQFGLVFLSLPLGIEDPVDRVEELKRRMDDIKDSPEAVVTFGLLNAAGMMPEDVQDTLIDIFGTKATAVMTNVPGPRQTIYLAGLPIRELVFWVPQSGKVGLGVSILSYDERVVVGFATDAGLLPDPDALARDFEREFSEMMLLVEEVRQAEEWDKKLEALEEEAARPATARTYTTVESDLTSGLEDPMPSGVTPLGEVTSPAAITPSPPTANGAAHLPTGACHAVTKSGAPCRNRALPGAAYCRVHQP